jgi:hypothetical protein
MDIIQLLTVFGLSILELWAAIPAGFAFNLDPIGIIIASSAGSIISALIVIVAGEKIRNKIIHWRYKGKEPKQGYLSRIWNKYGVIGLGLLSPLLLGAPLGAALGSILGAQRWRLLFWMSLGIIIWSIGLTLACATGIKSLESLF